MTGLLIMIGLLGVAWAIFELAEAVDRHGRN